MVEQIHILVANLVEVIFSLDIHRRDFHPVSIFPVASRCTYLTKIDLRKKAALIQLFLFTGDQKTSTVESANGNEAHFKNGILRPFFEVHRSDHDAIIGSVNASKILPNAVIPPIIVKIPSTTSPCGINTDCPWLIDA